MTNAQLSKEFVEEYLIQKYGEKNIGYDGSDFKRVLYFYIDGRNLGYIVITSEPLKVEIPISGKYSNVRENIGSLNNLASLYSSECCEEDDRVFIRKYIETTEDIDKIYELGCKLKELRARAGEDQLKLDKGLEALLAEPA